MFLLLSVLYSCLFPNSIICDENYELDYGSQGHLVGFVEWREGSKLGVWNGSINKRIEELEYNENWRELVEMFNFPADCNVFLCLSKPGHICKQTQTGFCAFCNTYSWMNLIK